MRRGREEGAEEGIYKVSCVCALTWHRPVLPS